MSLHAPQPIDRSMPHWLRSNWLGEAQAEGLWNFAVAREAHFKPGTIADRPAVGTIDPLGRRSLVLRDLGPFTEQLQTRALALQPEIETAFGMPHVPTLDVELEIVAHRDGDFYQAHIDTFTRKEGAIELTRRLSLLYYFHREPKVFAGGHLRLRGLGSGRTVSLAPVRDSLVAFPSFLPHEVEPVACPGGTFADSRFSLNIWLCGSTTGQRS